MSSTTKQPPIDQLLIQPRTPFYYPDTSTPDLERFGGSIWSKDLGFLQKENVLKDDNPVDYPLPPTYLVATRPETPLDVWKLASRQILSRRECMDALGGALRASREGVDVFLVSGQPDIGLFSPDPHRLQNLIFGQENRSFCFGFSPAASHLGFQRCCKFAAAVLSSPILAMPPIFPISRTTRSIMR